MDVFKFRNPTSPTKMEQGEIIDGFKSKMWIERYRDSGEFSFIAGIDSGIREKLPIGTFVSHVDSSEIMIVENHEISENRGEPTDIKITGRGFESFLEQRIVSSNRYFPDVTGSTDYVLPIGYSANQALFLIENHIIADALINDDDALPYVNAYTEVSGIGEYVERSIHRGQDVYSALLEMLKVDNLGIKVVRPGTWSPLGPTSPNTAIVIHVGTDRSSQIVISYDSGEIESADYLWSQKKLKNSVLVSGKWVEIRIDNVSTTGYNRRMMYVDASDIDDAYTSSPTGTDLTMIMSRMEQRGLAALAAQKDIALVKAEVSKQSTKAVYRRDYNVGDFIMVAGDYHEARPMRVSEFVEIEDENGQSAYPTLTVDE